MTPNSTSQRYEVPGLRVILYRLKAHSVSEGATGVIQAQCLDAENRLLLTVTETFDSDDLQNEADPQIYFKTQASTAYIIVSVEGTGFSIDSTELRDDGKDRIEHAPLCDLGQYMTPIWQGDTVHDETVLLLDGHGRLLYRPDKILSVRDSSLGHEYFEGKDFRVEGKDMIALPGSALPIVDGSEFPSGDFPWLNVAGRHILVTYTHSDRWTGPTPYLQVDLLPATIAKFKAKEPVKIVAYGDSITHGNDVSSYRMVPPYMPTWADLFARGLRKAYGYPEVQMTNAALGGADACWGRLNARFLVRAIEPDLVIVGFGMNDFWSVDPESFGANIEAIIEQVGAEVILISSIRFDPAYTQSPDYVGRMGEYAERLRSLVRPGVALLDMTAMSEALYEAKGAKGLLSDPMHPADFLARWYAQGLVAMTTERIE